MSTAAEVKERPILFSGEMVRAILDGRKSQTRRVVKPQPEDSGELETLPPQPLYRWAKGKDWFSGVTREQLVGRCGLLHDKRCPYPVGSRLWVRETWTPLEFSDTHVGVTYAATPTIGAHEENDTHWYYVGEDEALKWTHRSGKTYPSIHMPRWASRITLEVTEVCVERLQDISEEDAVAEGSFDTASFQGPKGQFAALWDELNAKRGFSWKSNPFVWVVSFKQVKS